VSVVTGANRAESVPAAPSSPRGEQALLAQFVASKTPGVNARAYLESIRASCASAISPARAAAKLSPR